jgi:hypothetical protein
MSDWEQLARRLHRGGKWGYYWLSQPGGSASIWWPVDRRPPPPKGVDNAFFGVHPTTQIPPTNSRGQRRAPAHVRSQLPYVAAINCFFAEYDAKHFSGDKARALAHILSLADLPSAIVDSGGGYHCYWLFDRPFLLRTEQDRVRARRLQFDWIVYVGSDPDAKDLTRVLRLPGTRNTKPCYAPDYPTVSFVRADFNCVYTLEALEARLPARPVQHHLPIFYPPGSDDAAAVYWLHRALDRVAPGTRHGRNGTGFWLACRLRDAGVSRPEAEHTLRQYAALVPPSDHPYLETEALHSLASAYSKPSRPLPLLSEPPNPSATPRQERSTQAALLSALRRHDAIPPNEARALLEAASTLDKPDLLDLLKSLLLSPETSRSHP